MAESPDPLVEELRAWLDKHWDVDITVGEWWARLADAGYAYPMWPAGAGGRGASAREARTITAELARAGVIAPPTGHLGATLAAPTILTHGTPSQIQRFVSGIARGEEAWCQLFSEPGSGSDLASAATRAVRDGDEWIVNGQKVWNSAADMAQFGMLLARTDVDVPKHRGLSYFLIDMGQPGIEVRPLRQMNGQSAFCEVFLTDARVGGDRLVGALGDGWKVAQTTMAAERAMVAGRTATGLVVARSGARGDLDARVGDIVARARRPSAPRLPGGAVPTRVMLDLARERGANLQPVLRQRLAAYYSQNKINSWLNRRIAAAGGRLTGTDGSLAKLATARVCQVSRDLSLAILGAHATLDGHDAPLQGELHRVALASPGTRIGGGTDEVQLNVIGERALGLPREPSTDVDVPYRDLRVGTQLR